MQILPKRISRFNAVAKKISRIFLTKIKWGKDNLFNSGGDKTGYPHVKEKSWTLILSIDIKSQGL